jgi:hypothetical protein
MERKKGLLAAVVTIEVLKACSSIGIPNFTKSEHPTSPEPIVIPTKLPYNPGISHTLNTRTAIVYATYTTNCLENKIVNCTPPTPAPTVTALTIKQPPTSRSTEISTSTLNPTSVEATSAAIIKGLPTLKEAVKTLIAHPTPFGTRSYEVQPPRNETP